MDKIKQSFNSPVWAGAGFLVTAVVLLVTIRLSGGSKGPAETTFLDALLIGIAQMFAPLPGVSRSGLTVAAGLALGLSRSWAVGFSLLMAVPAILGASVSELRDANLSALSGERVAQIVAATIVAGVIGYLAIIWLVKIVRSGRLWYFFVYLFILGTALLVMAPATITIREVPDARGAEALDRPIRGAAEGTAPGAPGR
jgi:undecaprenyl-diphosphatase